nr:MAG TPA: hypothetical protein [Caudoviricetes sp.]
MKISLETNFSKEKLFLYIRKYFKSQFEEVILNFKDLEFQNNFLE